MLRICFIRSETRAQGLCGVHVAASVVAVCADGDQRQNTRFGVPNVEVLSLFVCVARAQSARGLAACFSFHEDTCIFPRDETGLIIGKPEVNPTFIPSLIHVYLWNSVRAR